MESSDATDDGGHVPANASPEPASSMTIDTAKTSNSLLDIQARDTQVTSVNAEKDGKDDSELPLLPSAVSGAGDHGSVTVVENDQAARKFQGMEIPDSDAVSPLSSWDKSGEVENEGQQDGAAGDGVDSDLVKADGGQDGISEADGGAEVDQKSEATAKVDETGLASKLIADTCQETLQGPKNTAEATEEKSDLSPLISPVQATTSTEIALIEHSPPEHELDPPVSDRTIHSTDEKVEPLKSRPSSGEGQEDPSIPLEAVDDNDGTLAEVSQDYTAVALESTPADPSTLNVYTKALLSVENLQSTDNDLVTPTPEASAPLSSLVNPNPLFEEAFACIDAAKNNSLNSSNPFNPPEEINNSSEGPSLPMEANDVHPDTLPIPSDLETVTMEQTPPMKDVNLFRKPLETNGKAVLTRNASHAENSQPTKKVIPNEIPASDDEDAMDDDTNPPPNISELEPVRESSPEDLDALPVNLGFPMPESELGVVVSLAEGEEDTIVVDAPPLESGDEELLNLPPFTISVTTLKGASANAAAHPDPTLTKKPSDAMNLDTVHSSLANGIETESNEHIHCLDRLPESESTAEEAPSFKPADVDPADTASVNGRVNSSTDPEVLRADLIPMGPPKKKTKFDHATEQQLQHLGHEVEHEPEPESELKSESKSNTKAKPLPKKRLRSRTKSKEEPAHNSGDEMEVHKESGVEPRHQPEIKAKSNPQLKSRGRVGSRTKSKGEPVQSDLEVTREMEAELHPEAEKQAESKPQTKKRGRVNSRAKSNEELVESIQELGNEMEVDKVSEVVPSPELEIQVISKPLPKKRGRVGSRKKSREEPLETVQKHSDDMEHEKGSEYQPMPDPEVQTFLSKEQPDQKSLSAQDLNVSDTTPIQEVNEQHPASNDPPKGKGRNQQNGSNSTTASSGSKKPTGKATPVSTGVQPTVLSVAANTIHNKRKLESTSAKANSPSKVGQDSENGDLLFAELKAMKISSIQARIASLEADIAAKRTKFAEVTEDLQFPAAETVKTHIKLLHDYNDIRDVGQGLIGMIADNRGVRIGELYEEFGVGLKD